MELEWIRRCQTERRMVAFGENELGEVRKKCWRRKMRGRRDELTRKMRKQRMGRWLIRMPDGQNRSHWTVVVCAMRRDGRIVNGVLTAM